MGLGGRREKQVIAADPRNTRWINDTSSPGHRLLTGMGYDPANASSSQHKVGLYAHESSRRLKQIPIAKSGMEGIGFKVSGPGANVALGALPTRMTSGPGSMASAASSIFSKLGSRAALQFVTAGASKEVINRSKTEGGEFGGLLARLNAANSASATPEPASEEEGATAVLSETAEVRLELEEVEADGEENDERRRKKRKLEKAAEKAAKKERKLAKKLAKASKEGNADSGTDTAASVVASTSESPAVPPETAKRIQHWNAARSRNLKAKRMLHASADAMAEILGIAPTSSPGSSGFSTPTSLPSTFTPAVAPTPAVVPPPVVVDPQETSAKSSESADAAKVKRKLEKKAAKALQAAESASGVEASDEGKKQKKKRKRET